MRFAILVGLLGTSLLGFVGGCGYSTKRPFRQNVRTVYVDMFQSKTWRRGIEFRLTEAVRKRIDMMSEYRNAPRNQADTILTGEVVAFNQAAFGFDFRTALPRELMGQLVVSFRWKDVRSGEILAEVPRLVQDTRKVPAVYETETDALNKAVDGLAVLIVERMETTW
jgi:hypothetical protein